MGYVVNKTADVVNLAKFKAVVPHTLLVQFHCKGNCVSARDGVHAQLVHLIVPVKNALDVTVEDVRTKQAESFNFGAFDLFAVNFDHSCTSNGASCATAVSHKVFFTEGFTRHVFKVLVFATAIVVGGKKIL